MTLQASGPISFTQIFEEKTGVAWSASLYRRLSLQGFSVDGSADYQVIATSLLNDVTGTPNSSAAYGINEFYDWTANTEVTQGQTSTSDSTSNGYISGVIGSLFGNRNIPNTTAPISQMYKLAVTVKGTTTYSFYLQTSGTTTQNVFTSFTSDGTTLLTSNASFSGGNFWNWSITSGNFPNWDGSGTVDVEWN